MTNKEEEVSIDNTNTMSSTRYKVVFVGDMSVGKTSIVLRFLGNKFTDLYSVNLIINTLVDCWCRLLLQNNSLQRKNNKTANVGLSWTRKI